MAEPVLLPIGHCLGVSTDSDTGVTVQRVRVGPDVVELSETQFMFWALAHGDPERPNGMVWGPDAVLTAAEALPDPVGLLNGLLEDGLLASVEPGTPEAVTFASQYQLKPLMLGLGNLADDPDIFEIGLPDNPAVQVKEIFFRLYAWGHLEGDLWAACQAIAREAGGAYTDPHQFLNTVLEALHALLSPNAAYLDSVGS